MLNLTMMGGHRSFTTDPSSHRDRTSGTTKSSSKNRKALRDAYAPLRRGEMSGCSRAGVPPSSKTENVCCILREEHSCHSFGLQMTLMTGFSRCLSSSQNFLLSSPHVHLPYLFWRCHLQLFIVVLSIWKTVCVKPKASCRTTILSKLLLTSLTFLTSSLGPFPVDMGSPYSAKQSCRA